MSEYLICIAPLIWCTHRVESIFDIYKYSSLLVSKTRIVDEKQGYQSTPKSASHQLYAFLRRVATSTAFINIINGLMQFAESSYFSGHSQAFISLGFILVMFMVIMK